MLKRSVKILLWLASLYLESCVEDNKENETKSDSPISVKTRTPKLQSGEIIVVSGKAESKATAIISTRVMGFLSAIKVKPGDKVQKGQLLAVINSADILAKRAQALAMISETEAVMDDAQRDYERWEVLYQQQSATSKELETAKLHYTSARAKAEVAHQLKNEANAMLSYTNLIAPFSGTVTQKHVDAGSMANPGMPILTLEQPYSDYVRAYVSENDIAKLKNGMDAEVIIKSTGKKIKGKVAEISLSSQFTGGQFQIKVSVPASESLTLHSGMFVNINIPLVNTSSHVSLFVPASAIIRKDHLSGLYTIDDNHTAQLRWLKVGRQIGDEIEILSGLDAGETFISESDGKLYSGVPVLVK